jgi:hypothetical protein
MDTDLHAVAAALAELTDHELRSLIDATNGAPQIASGLLAWIEAACDWELNRRAGMEYDLQPPEAAIPPEEDAVSIEAAIALRATFAQDSSAVLALFDTDPVHLRTSARKRRIFGRPIDSHATARCQSVRSDLSLRGRPRPSEN